MANTRKILAMIESRASHDDERFFSIALQIAAAEARSGRREIAEEIRKAVADARAGRFGKASVPIPFARPRGGMDQLLELRVPQWRLDDVVLASTLRDRLDDLIRQQMKRAWLREHSKVPNRRLLFLGPPGTGKTMTAEGLARELKLPLFVIRLESLITRYMGETAAQLRLVFSEVNQRRGVYLFDEFDALGARRDTANDVAEMRRVLNSFLQFMEAPNSTDSVVVTATNFPKLLDSALLRRFDLVLEFEPPTPEHVREIIKSNLRPVKYPRIAWKQVTEAAAGLSQSEIARAAEDAAKSAILDQRDKLSTSDLVSRLKERQDMRVAFDGKRQTTI